MLVFKTNKLMYNINKKQGVNIQNNLNVYFTSITKEDYNNFSLPLMKVLSKIVSETYNQDKENIDKIVGDINIDVFKRNLCKHITNELESYLFNTNVGYDSFDDHYMKVFYSVLSMVTNLMFNGKITSSEERSNIKKYIKTMEKELDFLKKRDVDIVLESDQYLGEVIEDYFEKELGTSVEGINGTNIKLLIDSSVGSGKSFMLGKFSNIVILKPLVSLVDNSYDELTRCFPNKKIYKQYSGEKHQGDFEQGSIIVCTFDQVLNLHKKLGKEWMFVLDEEHILITSLNYRRKTIVNVLYVLGVRDNYISISGTPKSYSPLEYNHKLVVKKKMLDGKKKTIELIGEKESLEGRMYSFLDNDTYKKDSTTMFYVVQDTKKVRRITQHINDTYPTLKVCEITSDYINGRKRGREKEGLIIKDKIENGGFDEYDVVITTPLLREGISLVTNRDNVIYLIEDRPNILTLVQQHDRVRLGKNIVVIINDRTSKVKNKEELFKNYYYIDKKNKEEGVVSNLSIEQYKEDYRKGKEKQWYDELCFRKVDSKNSNGLKSLESILFRHNVYTIDNDDIDFLEIDLDGLERKYQIDNLLESTQWNKVERYMRSEYDFTFSRNIYSYEVDNKKNQELEKTIKEDWLKDGVEYIFGEYDQLSEEDRREVKLDNISSNVLFQKNVMSKITNYTNEEMKEIILNNNSDNVGILILNWFISIKDQVITNDVDRRSMDIIKRYYFGTNDRLWVGLELSKLLEVGKTYTTNEVVELLSNCKSEYNGRGFSKVKRVKRFLQDIFNFKDTQVNVGGRRRGEKQTKVTTYTIESLKVEDKGFKSRIKEEYLKGKIEEVFYLLDSNDMGDGMVNPYIVKM